MSRLCNVLLELHELPPALQCYEHRRGDNCAHQLVLPDHAELGHRVYELQGNGGSGPLAGSAQPSQGPQPRWAQQQHWLAHCRRSVGGVFTQGNCTQLPGGSSYIGKYGILVIRHRPVHQW